MEVLNLKKVELRMNEEQKYLIIKKLVETDGNKQRAAITLGITIRQINRLIIGYISFGKEFFIHKNRGRQPSNTLSFELKQQIIELYVTKYFDCNFKYFTQLLSLKENITVSDTLVRNLLLEELIISPRSQRKTKRKIKKMLQAKKVMAKTKKDLIQIQSKIVDAEFAHPTQPRTECFGEELQMDACDHLWFGKSKTHLHIVIDDATGMIVGMHFDKQETLNAYYQITKQFLSNYGIPYLIKTDNRTVFNYKRKSTPTDDEDTFTQYGYACKQLGIKLESSSIPEFKPRVERAFGTLQGRLPVELRLAGISDIEKANEFLNKYITTFNNEFALSLNNIKSAWDSQLSDENINLILSILSERTINKGHSIKYNNKNYKTLNNKGNNIYFGKGTKCMVIKTLSKELYATIDDEIYVLEEIPDRIDLSPNLNIVEPYKPIKRRIPDMYHCWRKISFDNFIAKQKHRQDNTEITI